jgi:hypothetical protein
MWKKGVEILKQAELLEQKGDKSAALQKHQLALQHFITAAKCFLLVLKQF